MSFKIPFRNLASEFRQEGGLFYRPGNHIDRNFSEVEKRLSDVAALETKVAALETAVAARSKGLIKETAAAGTNFNTLTATQVFLTGLTFEAGRSYEIHYRQRYFAANADIIWQINMDLDNGGGSYAGLRVNNHTTIRSASATNTDTAQMVGLYKATTSTTQGRVKIDTLRITPTSTLFTMATARMWVKDIGQTP